MQEDETLTEQGTEESVTSEDMENFFQENADQSDEIQNFRNIADKAEKIMVRVQPSSDSTPKHRAISLS